MPSIKTNRELLKRVSDSTPAPQQAPTVQSPTFPNTPNPWQRGPLPPPMIQSSDQQRGWQISSVPTVRVSPLPPAANAQANASAASQILVQPPSTSTVSLIVPDIFTPVSQTKTLPGPLQIGLAVEDPNTVFAGPSASFKGQDTVVNAHGVNPAISISGSGFTDNDLVILATTQNFDTSTTFFNPTANPAWSILKNDQFVFNMIYQATSGAAGSVLTASDNVLVSADWAGVMVFVSSGVGVGTTPVIVQDLTQSGGHNGTLPLTGAVAGNVMLFIGQSSRPFGGFDVAISDDKGNVWNLVSRALNNATGGAEVIVYAAQIITGGNITVSFDTVNPVQGGFWNLLEISGVGAVPGIPSFRDLVPLDIPPIDVSRSGNGGVTGNLPVTNLGSGTNASSTTVFYGDATWKAPQYQTVQQAGVNKTQRHKLNFLAPVSVADNAGNDSSDVTVPVFVGSGASHAIGLVPDPGASSGTVAFLREDGTWVQPDYGGLLGTTKATRYNAVNLVSNGISSEVATVDLTAQSATIAATTAYAVPAAGAGMYRVSWVAKVTTAATASSTLGGVNGFQIVYTDANDSVAVTTPTWWGGGNNGAAPTSASLNTTQTQISGSIVVNAKASTNIQYAIDYTSSGVTAMQYNLHIKIESL